MRRSFLPRITVGIILMLLVMALAVGWQVMLWTGLGSEGEGFSTHEALFLIFGTLFFVLVMIGLVGLFTWLIQEMGYNRRQRDFLDAVTHEMKTPLASFRLHLDTLLKRDPESAKRIEFLETMSDDLDRLDRTVEHVLAAARAEERGRVQLTGRVDLQALLSECVAELRKRHQLDENAVFVLGKEVAAVRGDSAELSLVFKNLLENAVKYSDDPVEIRVGINSTRDGRVQIEIADRGVGIPPRELRRIFRRFYRVGRDVQRTVAGLGLGLFVVRSLVHRQGGRVVAQSEGAGTGSRFVVTLRAA